MNELTKFFMLWGPTLLFVLIILMGFLVGIIRGFRKSVILLIHMVVIGLTCLGIYIWLIGKTDLDASMVNFINGLLNSFGGQSLQKMLTVNADHTTLHAMLTEMITKNMSTEDLIYYIIIEDGAYIATLVEMAYRIVLFILVGVLYLLLTFVFYIIYLIAYPVRRTKKKYNRKFQEGKVSHPYKKKRLLGGLVGTGRAIIVGVISFSFLGALLWIVTGGENMPGRNEIRDDNSTISFGDEKFNDIYDYYSVVCEMSDSGIFKILNGMKDSSNTPFYFYISDLVLQGKIQDENLDADGKFYLRDETGDYVSFVKQIFKVMMKYSTDKELDSLLNESNDKKIETIMNIMNKPGFSDEASALIDEFEAKPFMANLVLSSLTSVVNHIDLAVKDNEQVIGLVNALFKSDDGIKVTDLATEDDVKGLFKAVINVVAEANGSPINEDGSFKTKELISYAKEFVPAIQSLSLFNDRATYGNKLIANLYDYSAENLVSGDIQLPEVSEDIVWVDEFNVLLNAVDPLLSIGYEVYDDNQDTMVDNLLSMFDEKKSNHQYMETQYDNLVDYITKSKLIDIVFKSSYVGNAIDKMIVDMTKNEQAGIPKNIEFGGDEGEAKILLTSVKYFLKNGGSEIYHEMTDNPQIKGATITKIFELLTKPIQLEETIPMVAREKTTTLIDKLLESKLLHYSISCFLVYADFGEFELYLPKAILDTVEDYQIVKIAEIKKISDIIVSCKTIIADLVDHPDKIDYVKILSDQGLLEGLDGANESLLLKGTIANLIIKNATTDNKMLVLPAGYQDPEEWLGEDDEIGYIIKAVKKIVSVETSSGDSLINELLSSKDINPQIILDISSDVIETLFESRVLRFSISNALETIDLDGFQIIIPTTEIAERNAATTTETTVNVLKKESLVQSIEQIKSLVIFEEDNKVSINEAKLFEYKKSIVENGILHATIINLLIEVSKGDNAGITVPVAYQEAFEDIKTKEDLTGNLWFQEDVTKREVYILLELVESFVKDASGNIDPNFSFESDFSEKIKIKKDTIEILTESVIINASVSTEIVKNLPTPKELYKDECLEKSELNNLLTCAFDILNKGGEDGLAIADIQNLDFNTLSLDKEGIMALKSSQILMTTLSDYMAAVEQVYIPVNCVKAEEIIPITQDNIEKSSVQVIDQTEYDALVDNLFILLADAEGKIAINSIDVNKIKIKETDIDTIASSEIISATLTNQLVQNEDVRIPITATNGEEAMVGKSNGYVIKHTSQDNQMANLLSVMIQILGKQAEGESIKTLDVAALNLESIKVKETDVSLIASSDIISATLTDQLAQKEDVVIPLAATNGEEAMAGKSNGYVIKHTSQDNQMANLLSVMIQLLGVQLEGESVKTLDIASVDVNNLVIQDSDVPHIKTSSILSATLSKHVISSKDVVVPTETVYEETLIDGTSEYTIKHDTTRDDLSGLLYILIDLYGVEQTPNNKVLALSDVDTSQLIIPKDSQEEILDSLIMRATVSNFLATNDTQDLVVPNLKEIKETIPVVLREETEKDIIVREELSALLDVAFLLYAVEDKLNANDVKAESIPVTKENAGILTASTIINSTIMEKLLGIPEIVIPKDNVTITTKLNHPEIDCYVAQTAELNSFLCTMIDVIGENGVIHTGSIAIETITLDSSIKIADNIFLNATLGAKLLSFSELVVPEDVVTKNVDAITKTGIVQKDYISGKEIDQLINELILVAGTKEPGKIEPSELIIDTANVGASLDAENLTLSKTILESSTFLASKILTATISKHLMKNELFIEENVEVATSSNIYKQTKQQFVINSGEIKKLLLGILAFIGRDELSVQDGVTNDFNNMVINREKMDALFASRILTDTISSKICPSEDLVKPFADTTLKNSIQGTASYVINDNELNNLFDVLFALIGNELHLENGIFTVNVNSLQFNQADIEDGTLLKSNVFAYTLSKGIFTDQIYIPDETDVLSLEKILDENAKDDKKDANIITKNELKNLLLGLFPFLNSNKISVDSLSSINFFMLPADEASLHTILNSKIISTTVAHSIMNASALEKPNIVVIEKTLWRADVSSKERIITSEEVEKIFLALLSTKQDGQEKFNFENFDLASVQLPKDEKKIETLVESDVISATISKQILNIDKNSIVCLDDCMSTYGDVSNTAKKYIDKRELKALVLALSVGLGKTNASNLSFSDIALPGNEVEEAALLSSMIIRATISRTVMNNSNVSIFKTSTSFTTSTYNSSQVIVFTAAELSAVIDGIEALGTTSFSNIDFEISSILAMDETTKNKALNAIATSDVYRSIISKKLMLSISYGSVSFKTYEILTTDQSSTMINGIKYDYVPTSVPVSIGKYHINAPSSTEFYYDFFTDSGLQIGSLFTQNDILALSECTKTI